MIRKLLPSAVFLALMFIPSKKAHAVSNHVEIGRSATIRFAVSSRIKVRIVDKLPDATAIASVTFHPGTDDAFIIDLKSASVSADALGAAMATLAQFVTPKARYPEANVVVYIPAQGSTVKVSDKDRIRLESILVQLKRKPKGSFFEIVQP